MNIWLMLGLSIAVNACPALADDRVLISPHMNGEEFIAACTMNKTTAPKMSDEMAAFFAGECRAAISAATDAMELEQLAFNLPRHFCPPERLLRKDLQDSVVGYLALHQERKDDPAAMQIRAALDKVYPCKN